MSRDGGWLHPRSDRPLDRGARGLPRARRDDRQLGRRLAYRQGRRRPALRAGRQRLPRAAAPGDDRLRRRRRGRDSRTPVAAAPGLRRRPARRGLEALLAEQRARSGRGRSPRGAKPSPSRWKTVSMSALAGGDRDHQPPALGRAGRAAAAAGAGAAAWTAIASKGARSGRPRLPSPTITSTLPAPSPPIAASRLRGERRGCSSIADHLRGQQRRARRPSSRSRSRPRAPAPRPRSRSAWQIAATIQGWEIVCPSPIGSAESA